MLQTKSHGKQMIIKTVGFKISLGWETVFTIKLSLPVVAMIPINRLTPTRPHLHVFKVHSVLFALRLTPEVIGLAYHLY